MNKEYLNSSVEAIICPSYFTKSQAEKMSNGLGVHLEEMWWVNTYKNTIKGADNDKEI